LLRANVKMRPHTNQPLGNFEPAMSRVNLTKDYRPGWELQIKSAYP